MHELARLTPLPWPGGDRFASLKTAHDIGVIPGSVVVRVAPHRFIEESAQAVGGGSKYGCSPSKVAGRPHHIHFRDPDHVGVGAEDAQQPGRAALVLADNKHEL